MPMVNAANYPYSPVPSQSPAETPGPDYQRVEGVSPEAFGAGIGRAQSQLGGAFEKAGTGLEEAAIAQQRLNNQVAANDSDNYTMDAVSKLFHGDPNKPGDAGYFGLRGNDALHARPGTVQDLDKILENARSRLINPRQQLLFDQNTRRMRGYWIQQIGSHYDQQLKVAADNSATAGIQLSNNNMASTAANQDPEGFALSVEKRMKYELDKVRNKGGGSLDVDAALSNARADATRVWADSIRDPVKALDFLDKNKDALKPGEYPAIRREYEAKALDAKARAMNYGALPSAPAVGGISHGYSVPDLYNLAVKAGYEPGQKAATAAAIAKAESSGNAGAHNTKGEDSYGLMQLNADAHGDLARTFDPLENMRNSLTVSKGGTDWSPWTMYKNGEYKKHMPQALAAAGSPSGAIQQTSVPGVQLVSSTSDAIVGRSLPPRDETMLPDNEVGITINGETLQQRIQRLDKQAGSDQPLFFKAVDQARREYNQAWADRNHQLQAHKQLLDAQGKAVEDEYTKRMFPVDGSPTQVTATEIANDKRLDGMPEVRNKIISFYERQTKPDPAAAVSARTRSNLYEGIIKDYGDPQKILDTRPIDKAFIDQTLTKSDHDWLTKQLTESRTAEGESLSKAKKNLIETYKTAITKSNLLMGKFDNEGDINYGRYQKDVGLAVEQAIKENKNPYDLFTEGNPNYLGRREVLRRYQEPLQNTTKKISEQTQDNPYYIPPGTPAFPFPPPIPTQADLPRQAPTIIPPRNSGETWPDYIKRTGQQ